MADKTPEQILTEKMNAMQEEIKANKDLGAETKKAFNEFVVGLKLAKTMNGTFGNKDATNEEETKVFEAVTKYMAVGAKFLPVEDETIIKAYKEKLFAGDDNPALGYLIPLNVSNDIIEYIRERSPMRQEADQITISKGNSYTTFREVTDSEYGAYTRAERQNVISTEEGKIEKVEIFVHEVTAMPVATLQMLEDAAVDLASWIRKKIGIVFAAKEGTQFVKGTGLNEATGFLLDTNIEIIISASSGAYGYDDLVDTQASLKTGYAAKAKWYMSRKQFAYIKKLKDSQNRPLINFQLLKEGTSMVLLGDNVVEMPDMPDVQAGGTKVVAYGDMSLAYLIVDRLGLTVIRDEITTKGAVKFWFRKRLGGKVVLPEALKILKTKA